MVKQVSSMAILAVLCASSATPSQPSDIHLQKGDYVRSDVPCKDAPFAAMRSWDGHGFGSPHLSHCTVTVSGKNKNTFLIENVCSAQGDGTPGAEYRESGHLTVVDSNTYSFASDQGGKIHTTRYRYCASTGR
jgi:hypothetical protein